MNTDTHETTDLNKEQRDIIITVSIIVYIILAHGITETTLTTISVATAISAFVCIGFKKWFKYKEE